MVGRTFPENVPHFLVLILPVATPTKRPASDQFGYSHHLWPEGKSKYFHFQAALLHVRALGNITTIIGNQLHLFPQYHEVSLLLFCELGQDLCHGQGLQISGLLSCHLNVNSPVCTHCQSGAKYLLSAHEYTGRYDDGTNTTKQAAPLAWHCWGPQLTATISEASFFSLSRTAYCMCGQ